MIFDNSNYSPIKTFYDFSLTILKQSISHKVVYNSWIDSFHIPEKNIKKGDPYQWQVEQTVHEIVKYLNIKNLDWILSYQSQVGSLKWIGPSTDNVIIENSKLEKHLIIVPVAFVSEHSETLVELDIEYKKLALDNGCTKYIRVPALGVSDIFIESLSNLINGKNLSPINKCPTNFIKCPRQR